MPLHRRDQAHTIVNGNQLTSSPASSVLIIFKKDRASKSTHFTTQSLAVGDAAFRGITLLIWTHTAYFDARIRSNKAL